MSSVMGRDAHQLGNYASFEDPNNAGWMLVAAIVFGTLMFGILLVICKLCESKSCTETDQSANTSMQTEIPPSRPPVDIKLDLERDEHVINSMDTVVMTTDKQVMVMPLLRAA